PPARQGDAHGHGNPPVIRMRRPIITEPGRLCDTIDYALRTAVVRCRLLNSVCFLRFFGDKVAFRAAVAAQSAASRFTTTLCHTGLPIHEDVEIVGVEHE